MLEAKQQIMTLLDFMSEKQAQNVLNYMRKKYRLSPIHPTWDDIEETEPDAVDLKMLESADNDPDCKEFISEEEALKELGIH